MPDPDTEPDNYSIDEMMERLRSRSSGPREGEAELVTREDGSQVYRVRKRKRRTHQPKKEAEKRQRRFKVVQVVGGVGLLGLVGLGLLGSVVYLNTPAFRNRLVAKAESCTGAKVAVSGMRVTPMTFGAGNITFEWPQGSLLQKLIVNGVSSDLNPTSLFGNWKGNEMAASNESLLMLGFPSAGAPPSKPHEGELPFQFRYRGRKLDVTGGDPNQPVFRVDDSEAVLTILDKEGSAGNLLLEGGTFALSGWETFGLEFLSIQMVNEGLRLGTLRLNPASGSKARLVVDNPENHTVTFDGQPSHYQLELSRVPISSLMGAGLGKLFTAEIDSVQDKDVEQGVLSITLPSAQPIGFRAPFRARPTVVPTLSGLPFLERLKDDLKSAVYTKPAFDLQADGVAIRDAEGVQLEQLELRTRGYIAIRGSIRVKTTGELSGVLDIGVPEASVHDAGAAYVRTFRRMEAGTAWATVKLSGTVAAPADDFAAQLQRGPVGTTTRSGDLDKEWEDLTR